MPVSLPQGVTATVTGDTVTVKGAKGTISLDLRPGLKLVQEAGSVRVEPAEPTRESLMHAGSLRSHLANVVLGVSKGYERKLELVGVGYRAQAQGRNLNLTLGFSHPVVYAVAADAADPELAVRLLGHASAADLNTDHAVTTTHIGIKPEQLEDKRYAEAWPLARATELLKITKFLPNNPQFGDLNAIIYSALQGIETGRLTAEEAADFVVEEASASLEGVVVK